ncbi:MAG: trigger factor family protein, partial [Pseudomonadota bacterium]
MMKITSHKHDLLNHSFEIALEQPIIHERVDTRLHELARQARLPGFRPGKVPVK